MKKHNDGQTEFYFMQEEKEPVFVPVRIADPQTDNEKLNNMQADYYSGSKAALGFMFLELRRIAVKMIALERDKKKFFMDRYMINDKATDAAALVIEQYSKNQLVVTKSFTAYLYLQVRKVLYAQTKGERLEHWCEENGVNLFSLSGQDREKIKGEV